MANEFKLVKLLDSPVQININVTPKGTYDNATTYQVGDIVFYQGASYIARLETTGNLPTNTTYWQFLISSQEYFETISKNIKSCNSSFNYTGDKLTSVVYTENSDTITKTLNYTGDKLTSVVLSGDTPIGIDLTKTLTYTGDQLTSVAYT
jgi:hypothetical protein